MSWNSLKHIDPETFLDTPQLQDLDLSHNTLKILLGQQYLLHTGSLTMLNLAYNEFLNMTLGAEFSSLLKLEKLAVGAKNVRIGDFKNIVKLKLLTLTLCLEAELSYESGSLKDVSAQRVQIVATSNPKIDYNLTADALLFFDKVELLDLTGGYRSLSEELQRVKINTSSLYLTNITLEWKDLTNFVNAVLRTSIEHLSATDVAIYNPPYGDTDVVKSTRVRSFAARRAVVKSFYFSQKSVYNFFINMPVESLAITETSIIHMTCPKSQSPILQLDFSLCALSDTIFSTVEGQTTIECKNLGNLRKLVLVGNNLKKLHLLSKRVQYMNSLQHLDLSLNSLVYDSAEECIWPRNLTNMTLSSNGLTDSVFKCLPKGVKTLDLQNNQISVVPSSISKLENLSSLNLNANRLRDLPVCDHFPTLQELLLKSNSLHAPAVNKLTSCPKLNTLDVSHNPFTCTCVLRSFIELGVTSEKKKKRHTGFELLGWPFDYYCSYPEDVRDTTLENISIPEVYCDVGILAATILCPAVAVIIAVVTLCHHLDVPWYMGMIWQWTRAKHRARTRQIRPEDLVGVEFHAFLSYSQHDADWVRNTLLPNLEGPAGGLRICQHEKNFMPGKTIIENIINCVEKSRRSVFVLSAHFVKSEWCHYELYFASHQRLSRGSDSVVLVLLEPLPQYLIPSKYYQLKSMMGRHTYLEWPQDRAKHRLFWANLRAALQADLPNAPVLETEE